METKEYHKTPVIYEENKDPNQERVAFVAIQTETKPPFVYGTFFERREDLPRLPNDILTLPIEQARRLFDFRRGSLDECAR